MKKLLNALLGAVTFALLFQVYGYGQVTPGPNVTIQSVFGPPPGGIPVGGPGLSTDYALAAWNGTGGNLLRNTAVITDANGDLSMPSTATNGLQLYNTVDQVTNYERVGMAWAANVFRIEGTQGGTGSGRALLIGRASANNLVFNSLVTDTGGWNALKGVSVSTPNSLFFGIGNGFTSTATSGTNIGVAITPTYNQASGNAANTDLLVNRTETAVGSGAQSLMDLQVATTSRFSVSNNGLVRIAPGSGNAFLNMVAGGSAVFQYSSNDRMIFSAFQTSFSYPNASTSTSGSVTAFSITPLYNQASGNAANTDLLINRTQTAVGSGTQLLIDAQVGGVSKFKVDNGGGTTASAFYANNYNSSSGPITITGTGANSVTIQTNSTTALTIDSSQNAQFAKKVTSYNGVSTAGMGVGVVVANPRQTAVTNATATLATYTVPASDSTYRISANVQVTAATTAAMTVVCTYTDETNTVRAQTIPFVQLAGTFLTSITNVTGTGPYEGATLQIRCKASTTIVFTTTGTVTGITYNVEGLVIQDS